VILPEVRQRRGEAHVFRAWSAGCASGEEAYSLAILCEQEGLGDRVHLLATDLCQAALARADHGVYRAWSLRGEARAAALPYLERDGDSYRVPQAIRRRVVLRPLNLAFDAYPSFATGTWGMDLILCRNVLIYFDADTVRTVACRLHDSLADGGWLITASSDPPAAAAAPFETVVADGGVFYRRRGGAVPPPCEAAVSLPEVDEPAASAPGSPDSEIPTTPAPVLSTDDARAAFARGEYGRAAALTRDCGGGADLAGLHVRALANLDTAAAERACAAAVQRHPLSTELSYLHVLLLLELRRDEEACRAVRRVLYLDGSLAMAHFTLGSILRRQRDLAGARRAFRNARDLCAACPPSQPLPLSDGEEAGRLAAAADAQLAQLDANPGRGP
jgi:chemotaxis protein methyltransferase CheR